MGPCAGGERRGRPAARQLRDAPARGPWRLALCVPLAAMALAGCAGEEGHGAASTVTAARHKPSGAPSQHAGSGASAARSHRSGGAGATASTAAPTPARPVSSAPRVTVPAHVGSQWRLVATAHEEPAGWLAQRGGVTLLRFDQRLVHLVLHAGSAEPGGSGWPNGDEIGPHEVHRVIAAFNGGFRLGYGSVGFVVGHRVAVPLSDGLA
jgi:hypothetical protein